MGSCAHGRGGGGKWEQELLLAAELVGLGWEKSVAFPPPARYNEVPEIREEFLVIRLFTALGFCWRFEEGEWQLPNVDSVVRFKTTRLNAEQLC